MPVTALLLNLFAPFLLAQQEPPVLPPTTLPVAEAEVVHSYPHDPGAYTEGLFWQGGHLWESTGEVGQSTIRKVDLKSGKVLARASLAGSYYGEGIAPWGDTILSLTWKDGVGFRWNSRSLKRTGRFRYAGEGWALTGDGTGHGLIMSDGTPVLRFVDPATFQVTRRVTVTADGQPVFNLNEIEWVDGEILANVWLTDRIARIDPVTGNVTGWIDVSRLHTLAGTTDENAVANGIAWDEKDKRLFVTGKHWPYMFEIRLPKHAA